MIPNLRSLGEKMLAVLPQNLQTDIVEYLYLAEIVSRKFYHGKDKIRDTDIFSIACQELVQCVQKYQPDIGPFDRFAMRAMKNGILHYLRSKSRKKRTAEICNLSEQEWQEVPDEHQELNPEILQKLLADLPIEDQNLIIGVYIENLPIIEVAEKLSVSRVTIYARIQRILKKLRENFEEFNVYSEG